MNKYRNTQKDIHSRIYRFVSNCFIEIVKKIPKSAENMSIITQISSSLTSIGANDQEADGAGSKKDFIVKYVIVKKETKETKYWLTLIKDCQLIHSSVLIPYIQECEEILLVVSAIILKTKFPTQS